MLMNRYCWETPTVTEVACEINALLLERVRQSWTRFLHAACSWLPLELALALAF